MNPNSVYVQIYSELLVLPSQTLRQMAKEVYGLLMADEMTNQEVIEQCALIESTNYVH